MKKLRRFSMLCAAAALASGAAVPASAASSNGDEIPKEILLFADRMEEKFGLPIDGTDYELRHEGGEVWIVHKEAETPEVKTVGNTQSTTDGQAAVEKVVALGSTKPPTSVEVKRQQEAGEVTIMQDTEWYQPVCFSRLTDPEDAGTMDACYKWGDMNYSGQTRQNWAFHFYGSCWPGGADFYEIKECYVDTVKHSTSGTLYWNDWSPRGTIDLSGCGSFTLGIAAGPVNAGWTHNSCGEIIPEKGSAAADMRTRMVDDIYWTDEVREVAQIIGIGAAYGDDVVLSPTYGYFYAPCSWSGFPWCG